MAIDYFTDFPEGKINKRIIYIAKNIIKDF